jgi:hypothetical protein
MEARQTRTTSSGACMPRYTFWIDDHDSITPAPDADLA